MYHDILWYFGVVNIWLKCIHKMAYSYQEDNMTSKTDKIIDLTRNKSKKMSIMINDELWDLFKQACAKNNTTPTSKIEKWMVNYVDENELI